MLYYWLKRYINSLCSWSLGPNLLIFLLWTNTKMSQCINTGTSIWSFYKTFTNLVSAYAILLFFLLAYFCVLGKSIYFIVVLLFLLYLYKLCMQQQCKPFILLQLLKTCMWILFIFPERNSHFCDQTIIVLICDFFHFFLKLLSFSK